MQFPPDWKNPRAYPDPHSTQPKEFAWEFLRRNPKYHESYREFVREYDALRNDYPNAKRYKSAWQALVHDRRFHVYEPPTRPNESERAWIRRVGSASMTPINWWYASLWGIREWPPDPGEDRPDIVWERWPGMVKILSAHRPDEYLAGRNGKIGLGFDLALPVAPQIEAAKRYLKDHKKWLRAQPDPTVPVVEPRPNRGPKLVILLRALDGRACNASVKEIGAVLFPRSPNDYPGRLRDHKVQQALKAARAMRDAGYRDLLMSR